MKNAFRSIRLVLLVWLAGTLRPHLAVQAATEPNRLLLIAPEAFHPALAEFVAFKQGLLPTELRSTEEILSRGEGVDDPEKLKRFIYQAWKERAVRYVLLVGDVDVLPVRYMVLDRMTPAAFNYAFYPSDLYYGDLAKQDGAFEDWNAQREGFHARYFGEVRGEANKKDLINFDGVDYLPDVAVGRWPVSTEAEVRVVAQKSTKYERQVIAGQAPHLQRASLVGVDGWVDTRDFVGKLESLLGSKWEVATHALPMKSADGKAVAPERNHGEITGVLNRGTGLLVHAGHGQPDCWEQCFSTADLKQLTNESALPIVLSAGCSTAHFAPLPPYEGYVDVEGREHEGTGRGEKFTEPPPPAAPYQRGRFNPTCLGEQILKLPEAGAVAYVGCNTGSQPYGLALVEGFVSELARNSAPRLGDCWNSAIRHYVDVYRLPELKPTESWTPPSIFFQGMKFMVFGDPSLQLPARARNVVPPATVDLRPALEKWGLTVRGQGGRPTCSVFTVAGALEFAVSQKRQRSERLSVEYLNWASNDAVKHAQDGGFFSDLWRGFVAHGICPEDAMPYGEKFSRSTKPSAAAVDAAQEVAGLGLALRWIKEWDVNTGLTSAHLSAIKHALAAGSPVCGGFRWPKHEQWKDGALQMCGPGEVFDGHSILLVGYKHDSSLPGGGAFLCRNTSGQGSESWMPYAYAESYMNDAAWIDGGAKSGDSP